jgi:hypothetical protein
MKTKNFFIGMLAALISFTFSACNDDDTPELPKNTHRVTKVIHYYSDNPNYKYEFTYDGEKLVEVLEYSYRNNSYELGYKYEITYNDNKATLIEYKKDGENWETKWKWCLTLENNRIAQEEYFHYDDGNWVWEGKYVYSFSGSNPTSCRVYSDDDYPDRMTHEIIFKYAGDNLTVATSYDYDYDEGETEKEAQEKDSSFVYNGNNIMEYITYRHKTNDEGMLYWKNSFKAEYSYAGDNVSQISSLGWDDDSERWHPFSSDSYMYNENGFLVTKISDRNKTEYEYEEGNGNASLFMADEGILYSYLYQIPTLKSSANEHKTIFGVEKFRSRK